VTDLDELSAKIALVRKQGWSLVNQELEEGLVSMAAAITDRNGQTVAALNISGQANRTSTRVMQETMLPALLETARSISQRLSLQRS
jgi:IclR family pca regulon transcriptional regulator